MRKRGSPQNEHEREKDTTPRKREELALLSWENITLKEHY